MRLASLVATLSLFAVTALLADSTVEEKTQFHFSGPLGGVINVFGGKATREGVLSTTSIRGDRKATRSGEAGEIVDLGAEKVYAVDYARQTYSVKTFAQLRQEFEDAQKRAQEREARETKQKKEEAPEWEADFDVRSTGQKEVINAWNTHEEIVTISVHEKGKKIERSGGFVLTADLWMGPKVAAMSELAAFDRRFVQAVYGKGFDTDMRSMMAAAAMTPAFAKAMKAFGEHRASFTGTAIRTTLTFETVAGTEQKKEQASEDSGPQSPAGALMGGLMGRMRKHQDEKKGESASSPNRSQMFTSTTEVLKAIASATAESVAIPAGFKAR